MSGALECQGIQPEVGMRMTIERRIDKKTITGEKRNLNTAHLLDESDNVRGALIKNIPMQVV